MIVIKIIIIIIESHHTWSWSRSSSSLLNHIARDCDRDRDHHHHYSASRWLWTVLWTRLAAIHLIPCYQSVEFTWFLASERGIYLLAIAIGSENSACFVALTNESTFKVTIRGYGSDERHDLICWYGSNEWLYRYYCHPCCINSAWSLIKLLSGLESPKSGLYDLKFAAISAVKVDTCVTIKATFVQGNSIDIILLVNSYFHSHSWQESWQESELESSSWSHSITNGRYSFWSGMWVVFYE